MQFIYPKVKKEKSTKMCSLRPHQSIISIVQHKTCDHNYFLIMRNMQFKSNFLRVCINTNLNAIRKAPTHFESRNKKKMIHECDKGALATFNANIKQIVRRSKRARRPLSTAINKQFFFAYIFFSSSSFAFIHSPS